MLRYRLQYTAVAMLTSVPRDVKGITILEGRGTGSQTLWKGVPPEKDDRSSRLLSATEGSAHGGQLRSKCGPALRKQTDGSIPLPSSKVCVELLAMF